MQTQIIENIAEKTKNKCNYISTKVSVDFFINQVKIYITIPQKIIDKLLSTEDGVNYEKQINLTHSISLTKNKHLILNKNFQLSEDYRTIFYDNEFYIIPDFFNKESIKKEDKKTWEMIFYQIFSDEVNKNLLKFKQLYKQNKNNTNYEEHLNRTNQIQENNFYKN